MTTAAAYDGDILSLEAWEHLSRDPDCRLIDVRTRAEWAFVGCPDLSGIGHRLVLLEWQSYPDMTVDLRFTERLLAELDESGAPAGADLLFLCRSGARSAAAAAAVRSGWRGRCFNVADGFEGPLDPVRGIRGTVAGWKAAGLPWRQS